MSSNIDQRFVIDLAASKRSWMRRQPFPRRDQIQPSDIFWRIIFPRVCIFFCCETQWPWVRFEKYFVFKPAFLESVDFCANTQTRISSRCEQQIPNRRSICCVFDLFYKVKNDLAYSCHQTLPKNMKEGECEAEQCCLAMKPCFFAQSVRIELQGLTHLTGKLEVWYLRERPDLVTDEGEEIKPEVKWKAPSGIWTHDQPLQCWKILRKKERNCPTYHFHLSCTDLKCRQVIFIEPSSPSLSWASLGLHFSMHEATQQPFAQIDRRINSGGKWKQCSAAIPFIPSEA